MKIKMDWVTNSSSVSFAIYGVTLNISDFAETLTGKKLEEGWTPEYGSEDLYELLETTGLAFQNTYDEEWLVGLEPDSMDDSETLLAFKTRIVDEIRNKLGLEFTTNDVAFQAGEVYDG